MPKLIVGWEVDFNLAVSHFGWKDDYGSMSETVLDSFWYVTSYEIEDVSHCYVTCTLNVDEDDEDDFLTLTQMAKLMELLTPAQIKKGKEWAKKFLTKTEQLRIMSIGNN